MKLKQTKNKYLKRKQKRKTLRYRRGGDMYDDIESQIEGADLPTLIQLKQQIQQLFKVTKIITQREKDIETRIQQKIHSVLPQGDGIYAVAKQAIEARDTSEIDALTRKVAGIEEGISPKEDAGIAAYNQMAQNEIATGMDRDYYDPEKSELAKSIRNETIRNGVFTLPGLSKPKYKFFGGKRYKRNKLCTKNVNTFREHD